METLLSKAKDRIRLSSDTLKIFALIIMLIDHADYGLLHLYLANNAFTIDPNLYTKLNNVYQYGRNVGRLAFPIFAFLLVEGFFHTRNVWKYAGRLAVFALVSELPFDYGLYQEIFHDDHQNVMLSLLIGLLTMIALDYIKKLPGYSDALQAVLFICVSVAAMDIAQLTHCDYGWKGPLLVIVLYFLHEVHPFRLIAGAAAICWEKFAPISFLILYFYDVTKKPSKKLKYFFYIAYPAHLILIYFIGRLLRI